MGVVFYPRIEGIDEDWTRQISGKSLARECDRLSKLIKKHGLKDLTGFYVPDEEERNPNEPEWFNPIEGIAIIEAMQKAIQGKENNFEQFEKLKSDLDDFRLILDKAASLGKRWNLAMDY